MFPGEGNWKPSSRFFLSLTRCPLCDSAIIQRHFPERSGGRRPMNIDSTAICWPSLTYGVMLDAFHLRGWTCGRRVTVTLSADPDSINTRRGWCQKKNQLLVRAERMGKKEHETNVPLDDVRLTFGWPFFFKISSTTRCMLYRSWCFWPPPPSPFFW